MTKCIHLQVCLSDWTRSTEAQSRSQAESQFSVFFLWWTVIVVAKFGLWRSLSQPERERDLGPRPQRNWQNRLLGMRAAAALLAVVCKVSCSANRHETCANPATWQAIWTCSSCHSPVSWIHFCSSKQSKLIYGQRCSNSGESSQRRERVRRERDSGKKIRRKKINQGARKGRKVAKHCVFTMFCGSGGSKNRLDKAAGAEPYMVVWEMKNCMPLWHEARVEAKMLKAPQLRSISGSWHIQKVHTVVARSTFWSQMPKAPHVRTTFGAWDVEKVHSVVVRSVFPSQNAQSTPWSEHFWKLRCWKSACRCGAKHVSKSKWQKHRMLFWSLMSKKWTPLREARFEVKSVKNWWSRTACRMLLSMAGAMGFAPGQKWA